MPGIAPAARGRRQRGNTILVALALLLVIAFGLGLNYVRNTRIDQQEEKKQRPYAKYQTQDLDKLAEGYRMELRAAEARHGAGRVKTRERYHLAEQVQEFERVQKAARRARTQAGEVAQIEADLAAIEAEQKRRGRRRGHARSSAASPLLSGWNEVFRILGRASRCGRVSPGPRARVRSVVVRSVPSPVERAVHLPVVHRRGDLRIVEHGVRLAGGVIAVEVVLPRRQLVVVVEQRRHRVAPTVASASGSPSAPHAVARAGRHRTSGTAARAFPSGRTSFRRRSTRT